MGLAYGMYGRQERCIWSFGGDTRKRERDRDRQRERPLGRPGVGERIILKRILKQLDGELWTGWIWLRIRTGGGHL